MSASENGWQPAHAGADILEWVTVPGTDVSLQLMKGPPSSLLKAWAADWNAYIEPLRDADSAGFTPTNSVATSNHLNGTAIDLNWDSHPFHVRGTLNVGQMAVLRQMLDFYEGTVFWAGDWEDPIDEMHSQMGYDTWNNSHTQDVINRKIRSDGFSTFRRDITAPPPELSRADRYALLIIAEGRRRGITPRGIQIALATGLVESNITIYANEKVPDSMNIPHDAVGSDGYSVGIFQQQVRDTGNGWWWGDAQTCMDPTSSAGLFYDHLVRLDYNGPNSPGSYAQAVQGSAFPGRYDERFGEAVAIYDRLAGVSPPPGPIEEGFLMALSDDEQRRLYDEIMRPRVSSSPFRHLGEREKGTALDFACWMDGNEHVQLVQLLASLGHAESIALLQEVAGADLNLYPERASDKRFAQGILDRLGSAPVAAPAPQAAVAYVPPAQPIVPPAVYAENARLLEENARLRQEAAQKPVSTELATVEPELKSSGDFVGKLVDSVEDWTNLALSMDVKQRAALAKTLQVLEMNPNGSPQ